MHLYILSLYLSLLYLMRCDADDIGLLCKTSRGIKGVCTGLHLCESFSKEIKKSGKKVSFLLIGDPCAHGIPAGVCCPERNKAATIEVTSFPPSTAQAPDLELTSEFPGRIIVHENKKLLPQDGCGREVMGFKVMGGNNTGLFEYPWLARLLSTNRAGGSSYECGGSLISKRYVLTAAHCILTKRRLKLGMEISQVRLGEWDDRTDEDCEASICTTIEDFGVEKVITHKGWRPESKKNAHDIALLRLDRDVIFSKHIRPICLPLDSIADIDLVGRRAVVAGWGKTSNERNSFSHVKQAVNLPIHEFQKCLNFYKKYATVDIADRQVCAGGEDNKDSCNGDSGGPLMTTFSSGGEIIFFLVGIVSGGPLACGVEDHYALYTKVSDYIGWIMDHVTA